MCAASSKRVVEVRLLVIVFVNLTDEELTHVLRAHHSQPSSISDVVSQEILSNLESVSYVDTVIVSHV